MLGHQPTPLPPRRRASTNVCDLITRREVASLLSMFFGDLSRGVNPNPALWRASARALVLAEHWGLLPRLDAQERVG
jgi:hypothetical protein